MISSNLFFLYKYEYVFICSETDSAKSLPVNGSLVSVSHSMVRSILQNDHDLQIAQHITQFFRRHFFIMFFPHHLLTEVCNLEKSGALCLLSHHFISLPVPAALPVVT